MTMLDKLKDLKRKYQNINLLQSHLKQDDILAINYISALLKDNLYIPFTGWSLRPYCLAFILNEILINSRRNLIEFGSGISTILIARLAKLNSLELKLISVEHNYEWQKHVENILIKEGIDKYVEFVCAPLTENRMSIKDLSWYDGAILIERCKDLKFDFVLIDGPPAEIGYERFTAMPFLSTYLADTYSIFLDDAHRVAEQQIIKLWEKQYNLHFEIHSGTLGVCRKGSHFDSDPIVYSY